MVSPDKAMNQLQVFDGGLQQTLERIILCCSVTERSWLQGSYPYRPFTLEDLVSVLLFALPLLPFLPVITALSLLHQLLISTELQLGIVIHH